VRGVWQIGGQYFFIELWLNPNHLEELAIAISKIQDRDLCDRDPGRISQL
jgi:hypothetical protein